MNPKHNLTYYISHHLNSSNSRYLKFRQFPRAAVVGRNELVGRGVVESSLCVVVNERRPRAGGDVSQVCVFRTQAAVVDGACGIHAAAFQYYILALLLFSVVYAVYYIVSYVGFIRNLESR